MAVGHSELAGDFLERTVTLVVKEKVFGFVIGDIDVRKSAAIKVRRGHTHGAALVGADSGLVGHVGERSVAIVVEETVGVGGVVERAGIVVSGVEVAIRGIELHVASDKQVDAAVAIIVEPRGTDRPSVDFHAGLCGDVGKRPIAIVAVKNCFAVAGDEQIDETVVVEVGGNRCGSEYVCGYARLVGDVSENAVTVIAIEMVVRRRRGRLLQRIRMHRIFKRLTADHVEIRQTVVVVVEPDTAGAGAFKQRAELLGTEAVGELDAGVCGGTFEADRAGRARLRRLRQ